MIPMLMMAAALLLFAAFHFLPVQKNWHELGWGIWTEIFDILSTPSHLDALDGIGLASFLMFSLLILSSPFLMPVWRKSKLALGLASVFSGLATGGFWMMILVQGGVEDLASGAWCLMAAPPLNLAGLLLVPIGSHAPEIPGPTAQNAPPGPETGPES